MKAHRDVHQNGKPLHGNPAHGGGGRNGMPKRSNLGDHNRAHTEQAPEIKLTLEQSKEAIDLVLVEVGPASSNCLLVVHPVHIELMYKLKAV
jgi:hypothetical protein